MSGFGRNIKYLSLLQFRYMIRGILFGALYGLFFGFMTASTNETVLRQIFQYDKLILYFLMLSLQLQYVTRVSGFACSMGCMRKNLISGQHIMNLEALAEVMATLILTRLIMGLKSQGNGEILFETASVILFMTIGMFVGLLKARKGKWIIFVLTAVIAASFASYFAISLAKEDTVGSRIYSMQSALAFLAVSVLGYLIMSFLVARKYRKMEVLV